LSSMGADAPEDASELQDYLRAKHNADEYLKKSNLAYAIVRPGTLNNEIGTGKIALSEKLERQGEISRDDVAQTLVRALHDSTPFDQTFEILKGEVLIGDAFDALSEGAKA
ncbi:NAD(P)H-binding protein, partial [Maribacter sp.]|nr:NAD(P)H-binding protein [Maribacter sp.]